ncbi:MAG: DUF2959 family protein [Planctomycetota bacterium]
MNPCNLAKTLAAFALITSLGGCSFYNELFEEQSRPGQVDDLVGSIERVYVDAELSKERSQAAVVALQAIVASDYKGDAMSAYAQFETAIERSEEQAETLHKRVESMKESAEPLFEKWTADLKKITSVNMRQRSRLRLMATRERYDAVVAAVEPTQATYDSVNKSLRDHALYLGHDLNPDSLALIRDDVRGLTQQVAELGKEFDECLVVAREYVDSAALPGRSATTVEAKPPAVQAAAPGDATEKDETPRGARGDG